MSFCYQENTHFSQAAQCSRENFWGEIKKSSTRWKIESRRSILEAVQKNDEAAIKKWLENEEYQKFLAKKREMKKLAARQKFFEKSDEERLLAFAQELKDNLTAFIFSCREFDENVTAKGTPFRHRRLAGCHLNGLVMLDIDHVDNPMEVWEKLQKNEELMKKTKLVHITSSKKGVRVIFAGDATIGNLADNQIWFVNALGGYKPDASCIDATRNSFAPLEEDILYIDDSIFDYYDEEFDNKYTADYRAKKTQPLHYKFPAGDGADSVDSPETATVAHQDGEQCVDQSREVDNKDLGINWREYDIQRIIDERYGVSATAQSCPVQPIRIDTTRVLNLPLTCWYCLMETDKWCNKCLSDKAGCKKSLQNATRTWHKQWRQRLNEWRNAKRSTSPSAPQKQCKRQFSRRAASHGNRLRRGKKRQTPP